MSVLLDLQNQAISPNEAYKLLYNKKTKVRRRKKAHFIRIKIHVPDDPVANSVVKFLFALPAPIALLKFILRIAMKNETMSEDISISKQELFELISYKGIYIDVKSKDGEKVHIRTF